MEGSQIECREPVIFDTTLREGFQTPGGIGGSLEERIYAAALIQRYSHWVELGMPANNVDYRIISAVRDRFLQEGYRAGIAVLARCHPLDIERAAEVMSNYPNSLMHLFVGTSDEHRRIRFGGKGDGFYENLIRSSVESAASRKEFSRVMFSPEDAYRTYMQNPERLIRFVSAAKEGYESGNQKIKRNAPIIFNLPDTVGYSTISEFEKLIEHVQDAFGDSVELSVHGHNDSGMAQAQAIDVYERYGVMWMHTTFSQLGERNGIASTDLTLKILAERGYLTDSRIVSDENLNQLDKSTKAILWVLGRQVPEEHLDRVNVSTAGIHTHLAVQDFSTYHIRGSRYGSEPWIELGPTSGSKQVMDVLDRHKFPYNKDNKQKLEEFTNKLKLTANARKSPLSITHILYDAHLYFEDSKEGGLKVEDYEVTTTKDGKSILKILGSIDNKPFYRRHQANGPVEAAMEALNNVINESRGIESEIELMDYKARVIPVIGDEYLHWDIGTTPKIPEQIGKNAHLAIQLVFKNGSGVYQGWARHENSTTAELDAVVDGMSKMYALQKWRSY